MWGLEVWNVGLRALFSDLGLRGGVEEASVDGGAFREVYTGPKPETINHRSVTRPQLLQALQKPGIWEP